MRIESAKWDLASHVKQVETDAYGDIEFQGAGKKTRAKVELDIYLFLDFLLRSCAFVVYLLAFPSLFLFFSCDIVSAAAISFLTQCGLCFFNQIVVCCDKINIREVWEVFVCF